MYIQVIAGGKGEEIVKLIKLILVKTENCTGGMTQVAEHLPSKHEALSSNPSTAGTKQTLGFIVKEYCFKMI
jgi:hypothetical protein